MLLIVLVCLAAALFAAASWWALAVRKVDIKSWAGASVLALWLAGVGIKAFVQATSGEAGAAAGIDARAARASGTGSRAAESRSWPAASGPVAESLAWPVAPGPGRTAESLAPRDATDNSLAASVESLIGPLEARLAAGPGDAKGWALLAQSYAYVGNEAAAQTALSRAVALGLDETALRERLDAARRSRVHAGLVAPAAGVWPGPGR